MIEIHLSPDQQQHRQHLDREKALYAAKVERCARETKNQLNIYKSSSTRSTHSNSFILKCSKQKHICIACSFEDFTDRHLIEIQQNSTNQFPVKLITSVLLNLNNLIVLISHSH